MTKLAIVVSDLHMGARDALDRFAYDDAFLAFCREVVAYVRGADMFLRFVLNGDVIDMWTTVSPDELSVLAAPVIRQRLEYPAPASEPAAVQRAIARGKAQIEQILGAHPKVARGLRAILETPKAEVVYLVGNHDHSMMHEPLQNHLADVVAQLSGMAAPIPIAFPKRFADDELRLYVEHGNQFSLDSAYRNFFDSGEADMGLYFLRFVGNRVRALYRDQTTWSVLTDVLEWSIAASGDARPDVPPPLAFLVEYFEARRDGVVPDFSQHTLMRGLYDAWRADPDRPPGVLGEALKEVFRTHEEPEFSRQLTASPDDTGFLRSIPLRGRQRLLQWDERVDRYWKGAMSRMSRAEPDFPHLDPTRISTVVLGHTHKWRYQFLTAPGVSSGRYFNSGSWTRGGDPVYVWVSNDGDPRHHRGLKTYPH